MPFIARTKFTRKLTMFLKIFLVILFSSLLLFWAFTYMYMENVKATNAESVNKIVSNYMYAVQYARGVANQIYTDFSREKYILSSDDPVECFFYLNKLQRYLATTQYLESFDIISDDAVYHIGNKSEDHDARELVNRYKNTTEPILRENKYKESLTDADYVYSLVYYETAAYDGSVKNAVLLNFSERWAEQFVASSDDQQVFIFNNADETLLSTIPFAEYRELEEDLLQQVHSGQSFGKLKNADSENSSYYITCSIVENKTFAVLSKEKIFATTFRQSLFLTIVVSLGVCLLVLTAILLYSRYSLMVVRQIKQQLQQSEARYQSSKEKLKSNYILELLRSNEENAMSDEKLSEYGICLKEQDSIRLLLLETDHAKNCEKSLYFMRKTEELVEQQWKQRAKGEWVCLERMESLYITASADDETMQRMAEELQETFFEETRQTMSVFISPEGKMRDAARLFQSVLAAKPQKFLRGFGSVVFADKAETVENDTDMSFYYSYEQNILEAIKRGQSAKARDLFTEFAESEFVYAHITDVAEMIKKMLFSFFLELKPKQAEEQNPVFPRITGVETIGEARELLDDMLKNNQKEGQTEASNKQRLVETMEKYIDSHYTDSKIYKRERNQGINDYINAKRMATAKRLIETTNEPILEIAAKVGITNKTHLYKLFKKYYNTTPTSFRKNN